MVGVNVDASAHINLRWGWQGSCDLGVGDPCPAETVRRQVPGSLGVCQFSDPSESVLTESK